eukprot:gnl/MRDRNA2_/MRDRNA2_33150_c0_seq1.p1 gnl/MRDRNA2_/MRDRNA2_33150_c0~~gnl/MRDRNA2_/MRDRNA2_33150_c0_seq1.p1  ORF type:complete len:373 (+),score=73.78 gnl/MRDRNA2_/MRDRNA2_33150_c0_seq1:61-1179(+)
MLFLPRGRCIQGYHGITRRLFCSHSLIAPGARPAGLPRDLAEVVGPTSAGFLAPPVDSEKLASFALSPEQVARFNEDGFVGTDEPVLTPAQLAQLRADMDALADEKTKHPDVDLLHELHYNEAAGSDSVLFHCLGHWRLAVSFHDILYLDAVNLPACQLLQGRPVRFWHDQAFTKPGGHGAVVQWHQDYSYWDRTGPMAHLTVHIALDDQTEENGALYWVPGSHRWMRNGGPLPQAAEIARDKMKIAKATGGEALEAASFSTDMDALYNNVLNDDERAQWASRPPRSLYLKAGHAAFHHALTVHGSWGNRSPKPRRAVVLNYFAHGTRTYMDGVLMKGLPAVEKGQMLGGNFHPVVFDTTRVDMSKFAVASV